MYVTLEPCSFHGRTPACALAIAKDRRIHEIYVSIVDPDPRNNGQGLAFLRIAGKTVNVGLCANKVNAFLNQYLLLNNRKFFDVVEPDNVLNDYFLLLPRGDAGERLKSYMFCSLCGLHY